MPGGGDWSGQPGHRCDYCGRSSDNVGPRRGFDYINDVCGGCCELSSDDDGHTKYRQCRKCKRPMYSHGGGDFAPSSCFDTYCAIKNIIDEDDYSFDVLGELAKDGETIYLCETCHKTKWKRHPNRGKPFPGYTVEEINESALNDEYKRQALQKLQKGE
ncbi:hypothetical protein ACHAWT_010516 [Skeletonema menzelii]